MIHWWIFSWEVTRINFKVHNLLSSQNPNFQNGDRVMHSEDGKLVSKPKPFEGKHPRIFEHQTGTLTGVSCLLFSLSMRRFFSLFDVLEKHWCLSVFLCISQDKRLALSMFFWGPILGTATWKVYAYCSGKRNRKVWCPNGTRSTRTSPTWRSPIIRCSSTKVRR